MDPDAELVGFFVTASKGIWYTRSDILKHVSDSELEGVLSARKLTATQRVNVGCEDGVWQKGGHTVAYCDKMIRSAWPNLPFTRPCTVCKETKPVNEFTRSATPKDGFEPMRPECTKCGNEAKAGSGKKAQAQAVASCSQKICANGCNDGKPKPVGCFAEGRNTCIDCRNKAAAERNVAAAAADPNKRICSGCDGAKLPEKFGFDSHGRKLKTCITCGVRKARYDAQPARREYHRQLNRDKRYWEGYRGRERAKDEASYLARNAATQANNIKNKLYDIKHKASERKILWDLTDEQALDLLQARCIYSGEESTPGHFGGIDRIDSTTGYTPDNCVPAVGWANSMKGSLDVVTFLQRAEHVAAVLTDDPKYDLHPDAWEDRTPYSYQQYFARVKRENKTKKDEKKVTWDLTEAEFNEVQAKDCTLCLRQGPSSIDRVNNVLVYRTDTVQPLCVECNLCKKDMPEEVFRRRIIRIADNNAVSPFASLPVERQLKSIMKREHVTAP